MRLAAHSEVDDSRGFEPVVIARARVHNPARGKAQGRIDRGQCHRARVCPAYRETDRTRESTPRSQHRLVPGPFAYFSNSYRHGESGQPDENQSGRTAR